MTDEHLRSGVYQRADGKWAWRIVDETNGKVIATDGGQGYSRRVDAESTYERVLAGAPDVHTGMTQEAPYPYVLAELVADTTYKPGWRLLLEDRDRGQDSKGLTLCIYIEPSDAYHPEQKQPVVHFMPVPPAAYNRQSWQRWLFEQLLLVERHEACEFFAVDYTRPYAPNHGPGWDPYIVTELTTDVDRRTRFTGEVKP